MIPTSPIEVRRAGPAAAATVLLLLRVTERTVMSVMGWSGTAMAARYQHVVASVRRDVAIQVGGLLWKPPAAPASPAPAKENGEEGPRRPRSGLNARNCNQTTNAGRSLSGRPGVSPVQAGGSGGI
jgi:hypothetical protein